MLKNKRFLFSVACLVLSFLLVACGGSDDADVEGLKEGSSETTSNVVGVTGVDDEIIIAVGGEIPALDPHAVNLLAASQVNVHVLSTLVNQDADMQIYPGVAASWEQIDDQTWQFNLRDDVYFHNGDKMNAEHVAFSLTRAADAAAVEPVVGMIDTDNIEIVNDYTIIIGTIYPFAPFLNHLSHNAAAILNANVLGDVAPGEAGNELIVGTGPYQVIENVSGDRLVMERWDDYHGEFPNMRLITYLVAPDGSARTTFLESGAVDAILSPHGTDIERLESDANLIVSSVVGLSLEYIMLNNYHIPDVRVRQAINYALETPTIVEVSGEGTLTYAASPINQIIFGHNPDFEGFPHDIERARELMREAGFSGEEGSNDLSLQLYANGETTTRTQTAEMVENQLNQIGIDIEIVTLEFNAMMELIEAREVPMATLGWGTVTGDADYALFPLFHSSVHSPSTNHSLFENTAFDDLIERARASTDSDERLALYWEAQDILREEAPWVLLSNNTVRIAAQSNVGGLVIMPNQSHFFGNIYFTD